MDLAVQPVGETGQELRLFPDWQRNKDEAIRFRMAAAASVALHALAVAALMSAPVSLSPRQTTQILASLKDAAKLVAPPAELTQKAPNRGKVGKEFELEDLLPRPRIWTPPSQLSTTRPAAAHPGPPLPEPPKLETPAGLGQLPLVAQRSFPAPPQIQPAEKPKLAFESLAQAGRPTGEPGLRAPAGTIGEIGRELARGGGGGGLMVGDVGLGVGGIGEALNLPPSPGRSGTTLELLSDPQGVDFRPYLITILSAVRRNWYAVIPESAKLGRMGKVVIQFAINKNGYVPKLVIASGSGTEALDRAAVAGVSASNPFPPLPAEFGGEQVRLQFVFLYNIRE